jgi:hypothetical protein
LAKDNNSKTILIIVVVILGFLLIGGIIFGLSCYHLYKIGTSASPTTDQTATWSSYKNARYGFSLKYPKTFSSQEPVNGDGVSLTSSSPAITVNAFGAANSQNLSLDVYLNNARAYLFKGAEGASEIETKDTTLGGVAAQERVWQYTNPNDGSLTILAQVAALRGDNIYAAGMVIANSDYSQYSLMFDQILGTYQFK